MILLVILDVGFASIGVFYYLEVSGKNLENSEETIGVIIGIRESVPASSMVPYIYDKVYNPLVRFKDSNGEEHEFLELKSKEEIDGYIVGQKVDVIYNSEDPIDAIVKPENSFWGIHLVLIGLGLILILTAYWTRKS